MIIFLRKTKKKKREGKKLVIEREGTGQSGGTRRGRLSDRERTGVARGGKKKDRKKGIKRGKQGKGCRPRPRRGPVRTGQDGVGRVRLRWRLFEEIDASKAANNDSVSRSIQSWRSLVRDGHMLTGPSSYIA